MAAADDILNRALADAVDRHATEDPRVRGILKRAIVVCHPESEARKKIALDTEQTSPPHVSATYGGSSVSDAHEQCSTVGRTHDTIPSGTGLTPDVTRTSSNDVIGDDVV